MPDWFEKSKLWIIRGIIGIGMAVATWVLTFRIKKQQRLETKLEQAKAELDRRKKILKKINEIHAEQDKQLSEIDRISHSADDVRLLLKRYPDKPD